jgi:predicted CxxxxCH...CXXCH cytochrome family protein
MCDCMWVGVATVLPPKHIYTQCLHTVLALSQVDYMYTHTHTCTHLHTHTHTHTYTHRTRRTNTRKILHGINTHMLFLCRYFVASSEQKFCSNIYCHFSCKKERSSDLAWESSSLCSSRPLKRYIHLFIL